MFIGMLLVSHAARGQEQEVRTRVLWDCETTGDQDALSLETHLVKQGKAAVRWRNHDRHPSLGIPDVPSDWTGFNMLRMWMYNVKPLPVRFMIIISSENPATEGIDYWAHAVSLNFSGWREFVFPIGQKTGTRSPRGWDQIDGVRFTAAGWGNTPNAEADVIIDDIRLEYRPPQPGPRMTDEEFFAALDLTRPDLAAVKAAVDRGDLHAAKAAFLAHLRQRTTPRWWFDWRDRPQPTAPITGGSKGWDYFATSFDVDWTGWKEFRLPLKKWGRARSPIGWHHINYLSFSATYGDRTPDPKTALTFDAIELVGKETAIIGDFESNDAVQAWAGIVPTRDHVHRGRGAGLWSHLTSRGSIAYRSAPHDWSDYTELHFWVYSSSATGDHITVIADSDTPNLDRAQAVLDHMFGGYRLGDDIDWESNAREPTDPAFTREWTYSLNRFPQWRILGDAYWSTGDEKYAREWIAQMRDWVEDNPYPLSGTGNGTLTWRTIEAGIRTAGSWAETFYRFLGSPSLTAADIVTFVKSWVEHAHHLMRITLEYPEHGGNWVTMECNGLGHIGILFPEFKEAARWRRTAFERMTMELDRQVYPDGAQKELTTGYHQVARSNFVRLYKFARLNDIEMPAAYLQRLERMYEYNYKAMTPDGHLPPLNDAGYTGVIGSLQEGAELFEREDFRWAATGGVEGEAPQFTSVAFPWAGQYVMRSGWQPDDRYLLFEAGPFGIGHQHEDKLSLFAYAFGRPVLTEAGTYSYDRSKYRRYVLGTWAHNTILVDGEQQCRRNLRDTYQTDVPLDNLWIHNKVFDAARGAYDHGYGSQHQVKVTHDRTVVFVRPDYWVVVDRLLGTGKHRADILWNLNSDAARQDSRTLAAWGTDAGLANLLVTPAARTGLSLEIVVGRDDPPLGFAPAKKKKPIAVLNYKLQSTLPATLVWVLTPFRGAKPAVSAALEKTSEGAFAHITRAGRADHLFVAADDRPHAVTLAGKKVNGRVCVVRVDVDGATRVAAE